MLMTRKTTQRTGCSLSDEDVFGELSGRVHAECVAIFGREQARRDGVTVKGRAQLLSTVAAVHQKTALTSGNQVCSQVAGSRCKLEQGRDEHIQGQATRQRQGWKGRRPSQRRRQKVRRSEQEQCSALRLEWDRPLPIKPTQCFKSLKTFSQSVSRCRIITPGSFHQRIHFLRLHVLQSLLVFFCHELCRSPLFLIRSLLTELFTPA